MTDNALAGSSCWLTPGNDPATVPLLMDFDDEIDDLLELEGEITGLADPLSATHNY